MGAPAEAMALAEAAKREKHKPRSLAHKRWAAVHNAVKGWHVALVDNHTEIAANHLATARAAIRRRDVDGFFAAANDAILAKCRAYLDVAPAQGASAGTAETPQTAQGDNPQAGSEGCAQGPEA